jgi:hypothetical protein
MTRHVNPGTATVAEIAEHWAVSPATARKILTKAGLTPVGEGWQRYRWTDIWRIEGEVYVPPADWSDYKKPLLRPRDLPDRDPRDRSQRTFRRLVKADRLPGIRLRPTIVRFRERVVDQAVHYA